MALRGKLGKLDAEQMWDYALRSLGKRSQSASELRQKLMRRAASPPDVADTLAKLCEYGLVNDKQFSESFAAFRLQNKGFGQARVLRDLQSKRVADGVAKAAVAQVYAASSETDLINNFLERKYRGKNLREWLTDPKNVASAYRRLRVAGFSSTATLAALKRHAAVIEEWDEPSEADGL